QADIVIANHSLIGVQAAKAVPAVLGSKSVGNFHHIVIDEAHALPKSVRSQGAHAVNRFSVHRIQRTLSDARSELMSLDPGMVPIDRKSTRLNSSHVSISYAVFCLKKKNTITAG